MKFHAKCSDCELDEEFILWGERDLVANRHEREHDHDVVREPETPESDRLVTDGGREASVTPRSEMDEDDWSDIMESEFRDCVEGRSSFGLVFEHEEIGLHGFKLDKRTGVLEPVSFDEVKNGSE